MELLLGMAVMAGVPAYFVAQPMSLLQWHGGWRKAALAPLLLTVPALLFSRTRNFIQPAPASPHQSIIISGVGFIS